MQRKRYTPGRAPAALLGLGAGLAVTLGALTGCSAADSAEDVTLDAKAGAAAAPVAPPGRYRTLFEPCGAVPQATLRELLPGTAALAEPERAKALRGTAAVTYDTDRRVGCTWSADAEDGAHRLVLDVERVVSYDPTVSDATRAEEVYNRKQLAAGIAVPTTPPPTPTATATSTSTATATSTGVPTTQPTPTGTAATTTTGTTPVSGTPASGAPSGASGPASPAAPATTGLEPRLLGGLGDVAFVDDRLDTASTNGQQRIVSVVFRTSNVIVTVEYQQRTTGVAPAPDSKELQDRAENLARLLADRLEE
ncbi:DUF3558 domain-containing protein [Streptomyces sp. NPDC035033]|uniref:DUF3558 domain-containing protein n=1 Tax=Streptomyces sp. NPDC035033 TaxID=3155368 RepID=UPI0033F14A27